MPVFISNGMTDFFLSLPSYLGNATESLVVLNSADKTLPSYRDNSTELHFQIVAPPSTSNQYCRDSAKLFVPNLKRKTERSQSFVQFISFRDKSCKSFNCRDTFSSYVSAQRIDSVLPDPQFLSFYSQQEDLQFPSERKKNSITSNLDRYFHKTPPNLFPSMNNSQGGHTRSLHSLSRTCLIAPKLTGIVSLIFQFALLIVSAMTAIFLFYHVGGYEYMSWNENSTILEPIYHVQGNDSSEITTTTSLPRTTKSAESNYNRIIERRDAEDDFFNFNSTTDDSNSTEIMVNETTSNDDLFPTPSKATELFDAYEDRWENGTITGIEQVPKTEIYLGKTKLDLLELVRISTLVYIVICIIWLVSMIALLFSIICEVLDLVAINAIVLTIAVMYAFVHALFIVLLLYFQTQMTWRTMAIVIGAIVILIGTSILGAVCLALCVGWYRYVSYMHTNNRCLCIRGMVNLIKGSKRSGTSSAYAMPDHGQNYYRNDNAQQRQMDIPYANEPPIHQFSSF